MTDPNFELKPTSQLCDLYQKVVPGITNPDYPPYSSSVADFNLKEKKESLDEYIKNIRSTNRTLQLDSIKKLDKLIREDERLGDLGSEVVGVLIGFLKDRDKPQLQFYAVSILSFVAPYVGELIKNEAVPLLVKLLSYGGQQTQFQALSALTLIACGVPDSYEVIIRNGALQLLEDIVTSIEDHHVGYMLALQSSMLLTALCRKMPDTEPDEISSLAFHIGRILLVDWDSRDLMAQTCISLSYLSYKRCLKIDKKICKRLLLFMCYADPSKAAPALNVVGNIVRWGNNDQIQSMIDKGLVKKLWCMLHHKYKPFRKEVCRIIANILAKNKTTWIENVIEARLIQALCVLSEKDESDVKEEAQAAFNNIYSGLNLEYVEYLKLEFSNPLSKGQIMSFRSVMDEFNVVDEFD